MGVIGWYIVAFIFSLFSCHSVLAQEASPGIMGEPEKYSITRGSRRSSEMDTSSRSHVGNRHGTRLYCPVSHYSYDDPIVFPGKPGSAHLHMFWGNTEADAFSTRRSLLRTGNSSCEGGINNRSSYWMPAVFNKRRQVVLPESIIVYYKSFTSANRSSLKIVPNGLQMLANSKVKNAGKYHFVAEPFFKDGKKMLKLKINFPECLRVKDGKPVLSSFNNTNHLSFTASGRCPNSHPYMIPSLSYNVLYDIPHSSAWQLASDTSPATKGKSLHADYIAAWDAKTMRQLRRCVVLEKEECQFKHGRKLRDQLPERFYSPEGKQLYIGSAHLHKKTNRTPFGRTLPKMQVGSMRMDMGSSNPQGH